jgi:hypothetical protein
MKRAARRKTKVEKFTAACRRRWPGAVIVLRPNPFFYGDALPKGTTNVAFIQKPGQGSLFKNDRKESENHPDYRGSIVGPDGTEYWLDGWKKIKDSSLAVAQHEAEERRPRQRQPRRSARNSVLRPRQCARNGDCYRRYLACPMRTGAVSNAGLCR